MATSKKQKESKIKARSKKADDKQKNILEMLKSHGAKIYDDLDNGQFPKFSIPSRSVSNIVYDKKLRQYILGTNAALRSSRNSAQLRSFTQLMWLAFFANRLTNEKKSSTLRDVYYSSQAFAVEFEDQNFSRDSVYYVRAIQNPTLAINGSSLSQRGSFELCKGSYRTDLKDDCLSMTNERAWSSPIYVNKP